MTQRALPSPRVAPGPLAGAVLLSLLAASPDGVLAQGAPVAAFGRTASEATDAIFYFDLRDGRASIVDRLRRDASGGRVEGLRPGLFELIGRPTDQPARTGEILVAPIFDNGNVRHAFLVESSTGYLAYLLDLGKKGTLANLSTALGRPFGPLAAPDGDFALLMRRRSGRSEGAYLVHGETGRGLYVDGVATQALDPRVSSTSTVPTLAGPIAGVALEDGGRTTLGFVLFDEASGSLVHLDLDAQAPERLTVRPSETKLYDAFPRAAVHATHHRFLPVALQTGDGTRAVLVVDAGTGEMALLEDPRGLGRATWTKLRPDLDAHLTPPPVGEARGLAAVERADGRGDTLGVFVLDGTRRALVYVDRVLAPAEVTVAPVALEPG